MGCDKKKIAVWNVKKKNLANLAVWNAAGLERIILTWIIGI